MATTMIKKTISKQLPRKVKQQLNRIYSQSVRKVKRHPYQAASGALLSAGVITGAAFLLLRYLRK